MSTPATTDDLREVAAAVRDLASVVADLATKVGLQGAHMARLEDRAHAIDEHIAEIRATLVPVQTYFDTLNKDHASAIAERTESVVRRKTTFNEWLAWITPTRAVGILATLAGLCGIGGPITGMAGKIQQVADAAMVALRTPEEHTP